MRIAQLLAPPSSWGDVEPSLIERGVGGRETCLIALSREWARMGHEVHCFVPRESALDPIAHSSGGVERYLPFELGGPTLAAFEYDAIVSVELPQLWLDSAVLERQASAARITHHQVAHVIDDDLVASLDQGETVWGSLSPWHARLLEQQGCQGTHLVLPNGVDIASYAGWDATRAGNDFFYSSSPDRGLHHVLAAWPMIRAALPDARLHVLYGVEHVVEQLRWSHSREGEVVRLIIEGLQLPGVEYHGRTGQRELAELQMASRMCLYPCDTSQPTETGCITLVEAAAAGAPALTTDCDCLPSEFGDVHEIVPLPIDPVDYAERALELLGDEQRLGVMRERGRTFAEDRDWSRIARLWIDAFAELRS